MVTREFFLTAYDGEAPPWDIGRPQRELTAAFDALGLQGSALDLGCGTGEHVLELARRGLDAWGVDVAPPAIAAAEQKRNARGLRATFVVGDALDVGALGRTFDTVVDSGLFHVIAEEDRLRYARELPKALPVGGRFLMLGFAAHTRGRGPRGYAPEELRAYFREGWREAFVRPAMFEVTWPAREGVPAWVSLFVREG
jgi:SAM-dependent methyltransferase